MEQQNTRLRNAGFATFFFSGICAISAGVVVSLLQERYGFAYGMTGTLLSLMSIGNLLAGLLMGMLPSALGMKRSVLLLTIGYAVGYAVMGLTGAVVLLAAAFFVVGIAKGSVINTCTILVSDHSADRTRGMNLMHSCYACGALLCPFLIAAAAKVSTELAVFLLAALGLVLWLVYAFTPLGGGKAKSEEEIFANIRGALDAGAKGIIMGRNIYRHENIAAVCAAIAAIVHDDATVDEAMKMLK